MINAHPRRYRAAALPDEIDAHHPRWQRVAAALHKTMSFSPARAGRRPARAGIVEMLCVREVGLRPTSRTHNEKDMTQRAAQ